MSPFQIILLALFGALGIGGILIFALVVGTGNTNTVGAVTIWGTFDGPTMTTVIQKAADSNADLSAVTYVQKDPTTYEQEITDALASGKGPDVVIVREDYALKDAGKFAPIAAASLSETQFNTTYITAATPFFSPSGAIGIPFLADPLVLYWNRDLFSSAGISQPPKYWEEVYAMAQNLSKKDDAGNIKKSAIAFGEFSNIDNAKEILAALILQAGSDITAFDEAGKLNSVLTQKTGNVSQPAVSALSFYTEFANPSKSDYSWNRSLPNARTAFATGDVAMYVGYASEAPLIKKINPNAVFSIAQLPQIKNASRLVTGGRVYAFAAPRTAVNPVGGLKAANELSSALIAPAFAEGLGMATARNDTLAQPATGNADLFNKSAIMMRSWVDPDPDRTTRMFQNMIEDTTSGASLAPEAIQRADQELSHIIGL